MTSLYFSALLVIASSISSSQEFRLPPTPVGKAVTAYFSAFNSGDTVQMKAFYGTYMDDDRPVAERLHMYDRMRGQIGSVKPVRLLSRKGTEVVLLAESEIMGTLRFSMMFSDGETPKLVGIGIDEADPDEKPAERATSMEDFVGKLSKTMKELTEADRFSGVVLVVKDNASVFEKAYGFSDRKKHTPNTTQTRFNIGSINKAFTSLAIRNLVAQGKLAYDDVVGTFMPEYPNEAVRTKVTIQHLLDMTSGIGDIFGERYDATAKEKLRSIEDYIPLFADRPLLFEPGTSRRYSNGGYTLLGRLIEVITGEDYYEHIKRTVFRPAGMADTDWYERDSEDLAVAKGYAKEDGGAEWVRNSETLPQRGSSAGGGYSTLQDLLKFTHALRDGTLGTPDYEFIDGFGIAGGAPGINAAFEWMPEDRVTIIVLSNLDPPSATSVSRLIRGMLPR